MSETAKQRIAALGSQLGATADGLPAIQKVAQAANGPRVKGKVVIITGANSVAGIGRATAHLYAENGARAIYICDFDAKHLEAHKQEIEARYPGVDVHVRQFNAAEEKGVKDVVDDAIKSYGRLDVFFANAGVSGDVLPYTDLRKEEFMRILEINTISVFLAAKYAGPAMQKTSSDKPKSGGSIVATASVAGLRSNAGPIAYSASKAAVVSLAQTLSYELSGTGVRVNAVCPGLIETAMTAPLYVSARERGTANKIGQLNPLKRGGIPDEVGRVVLFLGSDEASLVNGQAWAIDGGLSAGHPYAAKRF